MFSTQPANFSFCSVRGRSGKLCKSDDEDAGAIGEREAGLGGTAGNDEGDWGFS